MPFDANGNFIPDQINFGNAGSMFQQGGGSPSAAPANFFNQGNNAPNMMFNQGANPMQPSIQPMQPFNQYAANGTNEFFGGGVPQKTPQTGGMFDNFLSQDGQQGWGSTAMQGMAGLAQGYFGAQNVGIAKDQLKENTRQFNVNVGKQEEDQSRYFADRKNARDKAFA